MNSESFTAWQMPVFDTPEAAAAPAPEPAVDADPAPPPAMAPEEAAAADTDDETAAPFRFPTADDIEKLQQEAHREGYAAGYEEGTARVRMEAMRLHSVVEQLEEALAALDNSIAREVLNLGVEIARNVVRQTIRVNPEVVVAVVREAINQLPHQHTAIYLNPEDASVVRSHIGDQLTHAGHRIFEDGAIARGGCKVESGGSQIDATVPTRWDRIVESLVDGAEWLEHD
ncbi:flagellar assembly protein FliH [Methyloversatilis discipulorum]|uniref:flagellar assembly protein FliH n=1 Tax=Methyloversatilis discipulorum TaxID=1119528 RepID=UPI00037A3937|nr:flagellar assembly protein FliH [Methyloversatilis discipulorum]